jgi:hypothetical protein
MKKVCIVTMMTFLPLTIYADVIYNEQTYDYDETYNGSSIWYESYETADDFEVEGFWTLEMVRVWLFYSGEQDIRVDIFSNISDGGPDTPACPPPGDLYYEEVPAESIVWTDTGDSMHGWPIYQLDISIEGFYVETGIRYWLGLQSITGGESWWLIFNPNTTDWWEDICIFLEGQWCRPWLPIFDRYDCMFELHGTPDDTTVEAGSFGGIKALYR